jgi:hypothetical protein
MSWLRLVCKISFSTECVRRGKIYLSINNFNFHRHCPTELNSFKVLTPVKNWLQRWLQSILISEDDPVSDPRVFQRFNLNPRF